ncbi:major capsid protein [Hoyosella altamirensis]|uniref:Uncharacterized protein n=1 Tax=Hoyosella altamirensis TaxID=616997 RepID=A0A839RN00_9ACTN|nr:major capsid protein [Hoyosella altamirensis]MBB3037429.1 hypothetical protein [Hoyosella altamirensis]MBB3037446.1 hypothetical protein [Hoyosella altamirensis]
MGILSPVKEDDYIQVRDILASPTWLEDRIRKNIDTTILDAFYRRHPGQVTGGAIHHTIWRKGDEFLTEGEAERSPATEYRVVQAADPQTRLAAIRDFGGKFAVADEEVTRNRIDAMSLQINQLINNLARRLNETGVAALNDALNAEDAPTIPAAEPWNQAKTVGEPSTLTPNAGLPFADVVRAQIHEGSGTLFDTLVVNPQEAGALRIAYGISLGQQLAESGIKLEVSRWIPAGTAYLTQRGGAGYVGFEKELTVEMWDDRNIRSKWVQGFVMPAFAVTQPQTVYRLTGLHS